MGYVGGLSKVNFPVPLGAGLDESVEPFRLQAPHSSVAENVCQERAGALTKRPGYSSDGTPPDVGTVGHVMIARPSDVVLYTELEGAVYSGGAWRPHPFGPMIPARVTL